MEPDTIVAAPLHGTLDDNGFPKPEAWETAKPIRFNTDWQGKNADPKLETEVRLLWTPEKLYLKFCARYKTLTIFADAEPNGRRDHLWDRDVVEVFLQSDRSQLHRYKEFEFSPNGYWIDLDIDSRHGQDLKSGLRSTVTVDAKNDTWTTLAALPMKSIVSQFDPKAPWYLNFFRVEGANEPRFYSSWRPTETQKPNFHVPEKFGKLIFEQR